MDKEEICTLLETAITCAKYMRNDLIKDGEFIKSKEVLSELIDELDDYIYRCQQIIDEHEQQKN